MSCLSFRMIPPVSARTRYALGIISLFPSLRDPYSNNGYVSFYVKSLCANLWSSIYNLIILLSQEHFYDQQSGSGYLAWRIKTIQRKNTSQSRRSSTNKTYEDSLKRKREVPCTYKQLIGEECHEAISFLKHSTDESAIKEKMRATFQYRQTLVQDQQGSSTVFDVFPRFLNITGLVRKTISLY